MNNQIANNSKDINKICYIDPKTRTYKPEDQELEAHYLYKEKIQEVIPDVADNSGPIFDNEPLQKVQHDDNDYNVFANERIHHEQHESVNDTYLVEHSDSNVIIDSLDVSLNGEEVNQDDDLARQRDLLAFLIDKLKCEINDSKNHNKLLESSNKTLVDKLKGEIQDFKNKNKSLESSNNDFKEANNELAKTNQLMFQDIKKFQDELDRYHDVNYASKVEIECAKAKGFVKPEFLKKAQRANPRLYDIGCYNDNLALMLAPDSDETIRLAQESQSKLNNRPPMLEKYLYDSWKNRMKHYMENRENERMILNSVQNGPLIWPTVTEADGLLPDVYAILNHHKVAKEIWDRVNLLMQGTELSIQEKECKLYDEFDKFTFVKGEILYHLPLEWSKFVTGVKLERDLHTTNYDQLYSCLEQHEFPHMDSSLAVLVFNPGDDPIASTACYTLNRSFIHTLHGKTYYELLKGKKPEVNYFRVFGSLCYPTNDYDDLGKLKAKADIGIFVGYAPTKKAVHDMNVSADEEVGEEDVVEVITTAKLIIDAAQVSAAGDKVCNVGVATTVVLQQLLKSAKKEQEANIALLETWDDIQEKVDADYQLAERLQAEEQEQFTIE
ncbi:retrovirus-related pol polyprotein from transposon TNT 1-94 [Tanacetum coccineum]